MLFRPIVAPARLVVGATAVALLLSACGGGGGSAGGNPSLCGSDTQYQLARPQNGQTVSAPTPTVEIVANGSNNQINGSYQTFNLLFVPANAGGFPTVPTGPLVTASDPTGYHPFGQDFYYSGTVVAPGLSAGLLYNVYVNVFTSNCTPIGPIGQLST